VGFTIGNAGSPENLTRILDILGTDPSVDGVLYDFGTGSIHHVTNDEAFEAILRRLNTFVRRYDKPMLVTCDPRNNAKTYEAARAGLLAAGFPVYPSFDRAAQAYAHATEYWTNRRDRESERWQR
jgi:acyl-CoA synthetase (NDP forming)